MTDLAVGTGPVRTETGDDQEIDLAHAGVCGCSACLEDGHDHGLATAPLFFPDPAGDESGLVGTDADNGKPVISAFEAAGLIARSGLTWAVDGDLDVTFSFANNATAGIGFEPFTAENQARTRDVLALYADVSGLSFTEVAAGQPADVIYKVESDTANGGGYFDGQFVVVGNVSFEPVANPGTYLFNLLLHETGHAIGLAHPGNYNGAGVTYANDAEFFSDSAQFTNLSYFSEGNTGAGFGYLTTLGLHDILAVQMEYGANLSARTGNTVYGYNNTSGLASYDLAPNDGRGFSIWDAGGTDTLDFSGSALDAELDLREGAFSSVNGNVGNVSIAYGVTIENGTAGGGDDLLRGNDVGNVLRGGNGNDTLVGGADSAPVAENDPRDFTGVLLNADPLEFDQHLAASAVSGIAGGAVTFEMLVKIDRTPQDNIVFASYAVPGTANEFLVQGEVGGNLTVHIVGFEFVSNIPTSRLVDGEPHRLSVTWETSGIIKLFIDGVQAQQGFHRAGEALQSGGTLVIGQDQDTVGGNFQPSQILQGTVGDIRVFNDVRTNAEIANNAFSALNGNEQGLVHYWTADSLAGGALTDVAGDRDLALVGGPTVNNTADAPPSVTPDNDRLLGQAGDDVLEGGWGNDILDGGSGDDLLRGGAGADTIIGGSGTDTLSFAAAAAGVSADLAAGGTGGEAAGDSYTGIEKVIGTGFADTLGGDSADNEIRGNDGDDVLSGSDGDDVLLGGVGNDTLNGGGGNDTMNGGGGTDSFSGGTGNDLINTGAGADEAGGGDGNDQINGQGGDDVLNGGAGNDTINGAGGNDNAQGGAGDDIVRGGVGNDDLGGSDGNDDLLGQADDDLLKGGAGDDLLNGAAGVDELNGGAGNDTLNGGTGGDVLIGSTGTDQLNGQGGDDRIIGGSGDDTLNGAAGKDLLFGDGDNDTLNGGDGNDTLFGGVGDDRLHGQGGTDRFVFYADEPGSDTVVFVAAGETVHLLGFGFANVNEARASLALSGGNVVFSEAGVTITFQNTDLDTVRGALSLSEPPQLSPEAFDFSGLEGDAGVQSGVQSVAVIADAAGAPLAEPAAGPADAVPGGLAGEGHAGGFDAWDPFDLGADHGQDGFLV